MSLPLFNPGMMREKTKQWRTGTCPVAWDGRERGDRERGGGERAALCMTDLPRKDRGVARGRNDRDTNRKV